MSIQQLRIPGIRRSIPVNEVAGQAYEIRASIEVGRTLRGLQETQPIDIEKDDVIELVFEDATTWICSPESLEEIFPEKTARSSGSNEVFELSPSLRSAREERGIADSVLVKLVNVLSRKKVKNKIRDFAEDLEKKQLDNKIGLYRVNPDFQLLEFTHDPSASSYLLFIHGTNSSTIGSFGGLLNSSAWNVIAQQFGNNILAFQHESLTRSPLQNVRQLIDALPSGISLTLVTHSRGGLVGDVLSRFCTTDERKRGFSKPEIAYLEKTSRTDDLDAISGIQQALRNKRITIDKFIRVACPAQGTTLASQRLDKFLNVGLNLAAAGFGVMASPVFAAFKNLIVSAIDSKNDEDVLPGIEAMNPDSPFLKVLNYAGSDIKADGSLWCIAGNCKAKLNLKALVIIASKLFYLKDNDLVVNTLSMYQGSRRNGDIYYFFDEGPDVDHFGYFRNKKTVTALQDVLQADPTAIPAGFQLVVQEQTVNLQRNAILKAEGGHVFREAVTGSRPILVILPGIMGSNLSRNDEVIWINYLRFLTGGLKNIGIQSSGVKAMSLVGTSYRKIVRYFERTHDVVTFPFDWRRPLTDSAAQLDKKIQELLAYNQPIQMIGHSMGGVLIRDFIVHHPKTWNALKQSSNFRILFLGSPLNGSYRIPLVLFGRDSIIDKLSKLDIIHSKQDLLNLFNKMPGLLGLLPFSNVDGNDFSQADTWKTMQSACGVADWPIPVVSDLKSFGSYRDKVLKSIPDIDFGNMIYIAGKDKATPCGYRIDDVNGTKELVFLSTAEGDQSVTWETGIPKKMIENDSVYYVNVTHGSLANEPSLFQGISEILSKGSTHAFSKTRPAVRGDQKLFRTPVQHDLDLTEEGVERTLLSMDTPSEEIITEEAIKVTVSHGDLSYASYPVLAGHFDGDGILFAEKVIDRNLDGALTRRQSLGLYPGKIGSAAIELTGDNKFPGAIIIGLGKFGQLTAAQLAQSVELSICNYLLELNKPSGISNSITTAPTVGISALTIGCGYGGLSIDSSIRAILQGIQNANVKIASLQSSTFKRIQFVEIIEQYEDRALSCFHTVTRIENQKDKVLRISRAHPTINQLLGSKRRLPEDATEEWWNRITVTRVEQEDNPGIDYLEFSQSTGGAREVSRRLKVTRQLVEGFLEEISVSDQWSSTLAKTIFELLIPVDFKDQLKKQCNILWILDKDTAAYPWELLQDSPEKARPLSVNAGMIRQLRTADDRRTIEAVVENNALVVGDPQLFGFADQLKGAVEEAEMVTKTFNDRGYSTNDVISKEYPEIIQALFSRNYKIIHLAGHGTFDEQNPDNSGMLIGDNVYLSAATINQLPTTPELVFVNCCFLGGMHSGAEELSQSRYKLAANLGTQLIDIGVKAVIAAGWAVDDAAAKEFSKVFYESMFEGETFGDAVYFARQKIYRQYPDTNTWGAYQCYGDPFYKFREIEKVHKGYQFSFIIDKEAEIQLNNLYNELHTGKYAQDDVLQQMTAIAAAVDEANLRNASITEWEGFIYAELAEYDLALARFEHIMALEHADFTVRTLERYCNVRAKKYVQDYFAKNTGDAALRKNMNKVIGDISKLLDMSPTAERNTIMGSAYKKRSMLYPGVQDKIANCIKAADYYHRAYETSKGKDAVYALTNWLVLESVLILVSPPNKRQWQGEYGEKGYTYKLPSRGEALALLQEQHNLLQAELTNRKYWQYVGTANVVLATAIVESTGSQSVNFHNVFPAYQQVWKKAGSKGHKMSEIEHLQWLIATLSASRRSGIKKLLENITQLRDQLAAVV